jgi:hypothetical protein
VASILLLFRTSTFLLVTGFSLIDIDTVAGLLTVDVVVVATLGVDFACFNIGSLFKLRLFLLLLVLLAAAIFVDIFYLIEKKYYN